MVFATEGFEDVQHGHSILRIVDVLPNFSFTTSETKPDYW